MPIELHRAMDGPLQRPPDKGQDEGIRRRRTQPEPGALPTLAPSKWVAEGRKGDLSRACIQLNPQSQTPKAKAIQALENSDPDDGIHIQTWCAAKKGSALTAGSLCFDKVTKPFALTSGPGKPGFPHADIVEGARADGPSMAQRRSLGILADRPLPRRLHSAFHTRDWRRQ